jgi:hypothetical protein
MRLKQKLKGKINKLKKTIINYSIKISKLNSIIIKLKKNNAVILVILQLLLNLNLILD